MNGEGLKLWDANASGLDGITAIDVDYNYTANATYSDSAAPIHSYTTTVQQSFSVSGTKTSVRVNPNSTLGATDFRLYVGAVAVGEPSGLPPFFRSLAAKGDSGTGGLGITWTDLGTSTIVTTYSGPGAPADTTTSSTVTVTISFAVTVENGAIDWSMGVNAAPGVIFVADEDHAQTDTVDSITLDGFAGFTFTNTNTSGYGVPSGYSASAYDVYVSGTVTPA